MSTVVRVSPLPGGNYFLEAKGAGAENYETLRRVVRGSENGKCVLLWESEIGVANAGELATLLLEIGNRHDLLIQRNK